MTNFERLKQMDVIAFASATCMGFPCEVCAYYDIKEHGMKCPVSASCTRAYIEWLEKEAEEQNDD